MQDRPRFFHDGLCVEQRPFLRLFKDSLNQPRMKSMPGSFCDDMADKGRSEKREIANEIEDLMANKLVVEAKACLIHKAVFREHDGVV